MKRKIILGLILVFGWLFLANPQPASAQGTCAANSAFGTVSENKCDSGYEPLIEFSGGVYSCSCVLITTGSSCQKNCPTGWNQGSLVYSDRCCKFADPNCLCDTCYEKIIFSCPSHYYPDVSGSSCTCRKESESKPGYMDPCLKSDKTSDQNCIRCLGNLKDGFRENVGNSSWTALGCISTDPQGFVAWLLEKVIGIAGGIVFLLILYGGFQILTSTGDPEKLTNGKEIIVSAIAGLLMIVFSVLLLKIIGVDILKIPDLST